MATINDRKIIDRMIADNGETYVEHGEQPVMRIVEYIGAFSDEPCYGVVWYNEPVNANRYLEETEFIRNPKVIWERADLLATHPYK